MKRKRVRRQKPLAPDDPFVSCANCTDGWVTWMNAHTSPYGSGFVVTRCSCWHAHQEKIQRQAHQRKEAL